MDFQRELEYRASDAERVLNAYLPEEKGYQVNVISAMNYSVTAGGKRLRPILMAETYKLFGGSSPAIRPFMAAIEMIHNYSLVHDDLEAMDNDKYRRGMLTTHAKYGEDIGVLAGDGLLNLAFETAISAFSVEKDRPDIVIKSLQILSDKAGINGMIGGQAADVAEDRSDGISRDMLDFIYEAKTSALIEAAMMIGAVLGGASSEETDTVEKAASLIGKAFQIMDDILDATGDEKTLGKETGQDERNHKVTLITFDGLLKARRAVSDLTDEGLSLILGLPYENRFLEKLIEFMAHRVK